MGVPNKAGRRIAARLETGMRNY